MRVRTELIPESVKGPCTRLSLGLLMALFVSACALPMKRASNLSANDAAVSASDADDAIKPVAEIPEDEDSSETVETNIERPYKSPLGDIDLVQNRYVNKWINYFQGRGRKFMRLYLSRSARYLPMMKNVLRENGLPEDLVYVALIESGFSPKAQSRANAVGYWQFIRSTAKRYGLRIDAFVDERRDPVLATRAAAEYFKALHSLFGSWYLALAAYNTGENRVKRAVMHYYTRDFWKLIRRRRSLPVETKNYVPKFIAAALICRDPKRYGFTSVEYMDPLSYDTVELKHPISMKKLADNLNVDLEELKLLNPKFRGDFVPLTRKGETVIRLPVGKGTDALAAVSLSASKAPKVMNTGYFYYRIRHGDNLSTIAHRYHTTVSRLRRMNNLSNRALLHIGHHLRVPDTGGSYEKLLVRYKGLPPHRGGTTSRTAYHRVRRGENLSTIASHYGVSVGQLLRLNGMSRHSILRVGQRLKIQATPAEKREVASVSRKHAKVHVVHRGENLSLIADRHGVSVTKLMEMNGLTRGSVLHVGQRIRLAADVTRTGLVYHVVRRGENLSLIARKYGLSVQALLRLNNISRRTVLHVGQKLRVRDNHDRSDEERSANRGAANRHYARHHGHSRHLAAASRLTHRVRRGETLLGIANRFRVSVTDLAHANGLHSWRHQVKAGRRLVIPRKE